MIKKLLYGLLFILLGIVGYVTMAPIDIEPAAYTVPPNPGLKGQFSKNDQLTKTQLILKKLGNGPEDIAIGHDSLFYTGFADGRIVSFDINGNNVKEFCNTGGRPLGMEIDANGQLIVADEIKGLLSINAEGQITVLATEVEGTLIHFADDLDIASDGSIYFTDASQRHRSHDLMQEVWELQPTGRLIKYDPHTNATTIVLDSLRFANGVALGPNEEYVLVNETLGMRIHKVWLKGSHRGKSEIFINELPGYPDNISYNDHGIFWVALNAVRENDDFEKFYSSPFIRRVLIRLGTMEKTNEPTPYGMIIGVNDAGQVTHNLQDSTGVIHHITSVNERDHLLFIGSNIMDQVGIYPLR
jgi:hypothetical protein